MIDGGDRLARVATLLAEVGACYQVGRRYRAIAAACEERVLERALDIGSEVRVAHRRGDLAAEAATAAIATLEELLAGCRAAIAGVRAGEPYRHAVAAWIAGDWREVGRLAPELFSAVARYGDPPSLHHPVPLAAGRRSGDHFIPAAECATRICAALSNGLTPPETAPELGADETVRAVPLIDDPSVADTPITLAIDPADVALPICRVVPGGEALVYVPALRVPMRVWCASAVSDEWWMVRPELYRRYVDALEAELTARGVPLERAAPLS